jgi:putative hydrolase of HD superfamily
MWFGIESAIVNYIREVANMETWAIIENENAIGFISLNKHNNYTAEIHVMGVLESHHRQHVGQMLITEAENFLSENNFQFLQVKTLSESRENEEYHRTRKFYQKMGFIPVEEFKTLWGNDNPCLLLIKALHIKNNTCKNFSKKEDTYEVESILSFIKEVDRLKLIERQTLIHNGGRLENSAEHSWHLALTILCFQSLAPIGCDINKAVRMALLHDVVEIDAGDTFIYADQSNKKSTELVAANRIFGILPKEIGEEFKTTWLEFEEGQCLEAKFVSALDRFLPIFSNYLNDAYTWKKHNISFEQILSRNFNPISRGITELWPIAEKMIKSALDNNGTI